jgi:hypothetical protein
MLLPVIVLPIEIAEREPDNTAVIVNLFVLLKITAVPVTIPE